MVCNILYILYVDKRKKKVENGLEGTWGNVMSCKMERPSWWAPDQQRHVNRALAVSEASDTRSHSWAPQHCRLPWLSTWPSYIFPSPPVRRKASGGGWSLGREEGCEGLCGVNSSGGGWGGLWRGRDGERCEMHAGLHHRDPRSSKPRPASVPICICGGRPSGDSFIT